MIDAIRFREVTADLPHPVSARMLYEMAKRNDEWEGTAYEGSSIRGAIKGFFCNGVCSEAKAPPRNDDCGINRRPVKSSLTGHRLC